MGSFIDMVIKDDVMAMITAVTIIIAAIIAKQGVSASSFIVGFFTLIVVLNWVGFNAQENEQLHLLAAWFVTVAVHS